MRAEVFEIPTDRPEADGTFTWDRTTVIVARVDEGIGWTYAHDAAASLIDGPLAHAIRDIDPMDVSAAWSAMNHVVRNIGRPGLAWEAISAVDIALWDRKAKRLGLSVAALIGRAHTAVQAYASGGFTSYDERELADQMEIWANAGFSAVKMKVGTHPARDAARVRLAREVIGPKIELMVDANGAYDRKEALGFAETFGRAGVTWFEEPVSSEDLEGLRLLRDRAPMDITAGEYGYVLADFRRLIDGRCLDVLQADVTRCGGISGMLAVGSACETYGLPLSAHCAPHIHAHVGAGLRALRHVEYFHDHGRLEGMLFDGALRPEHGLLRPDLSRPGLGVELRPDAQRFRKR